MDKGAGPCGASDRRMERGTPREDQRGMTPHDLCALGAAALPSRDLLRLLVKRPMADDELDAALHALTLVGRPREVACRQLRCGPQLLAALELGRRAWMLPRPTGRRIRGPVDVVSMVAPRAVDEGEAGAWVVVLDARLALARIERVAPVGAKTVLRTTLAAGATRAVLVAGRRGSAAPEPADLHLVSSIVTAGDVVGVQLLDAIVLGEDGFSSLLRLGAMPAGHVSDPRYR